jgi:hypothetical protein
LPTGVLQLWGYFPIAITLALVCVSLLAVERVLGPDGTNRSHRFRRAQIAIAAAAAAGSSWLHPWQGVTVVLILGGLIALERSRRAMVACGGPLVAACLPLAYYYALAHTDQAWSTAQAQNSHAVPAWVALAVFLPLALPALLGVRRGVNDAQERILLLWPCAALVVYLLDPPYALHALESASLPLGILAVRGWRRLRLGRAAATTLLVLATVPGLVFALGLLSRAVDERPGAYVLSNDDSRSLRTVAASPIPGGVLAPTPIASSVPARTGRRTWLGHPSWTPQLALREREASRFFGGRMTASDARRLIRSLGVHMALAPCGSSASLERLLGPQILASSFPIGCARVLSFRP